MKTKTTSHGYSLVELLVVIVLIATLVAMLFPVIGTARKRSYSANCQSNLRQIGQAMAMYAQDFDDMYPYGADPIDKYTAAWGVDPKKDPILKNMPLLHEILNPYYKDRQIWRCRADVGIGVMKNHNDPRTGEKLKLDAFPTVFDKFGSSYVWRTELAFKHKLFATGGRHGDEEVGPASMGVLHEMTGEWHGGPEFSQWRFNTLMGDGHVATQNMEENAMSRVISVD